MDAQGSTTDGNAPLSPEHAALLAEFGYDSRYVRRLARRRGGQQQLADMVARARRSELAPRDAGPKPVPAGRYGDAPSHTGRDVLTLWLVLLPSVLVLLLFVFGCIQLLAMTQGHRAYDDAHLVSTPMAVLLTAGPLAALDALARWRGRRLLRGAPGPRADELQLRPEQLDNRPLPPVLQELAMLPILTLIPVVYVQHNLPHPGNQLLMIVVVVLVGAFGVSLVLAGGPLYAAALVVAWAVWAWLALHGNGTLPTLALLVVAIALGVPYFRRLITARAGGRW